MTITADTTASETLLTTLTFPISDAVNGIGAVLPHIGKDPLTPILSVVRVSADSFLTTNRWAIGQYHHGAPIHVDTEPVLLPAAAATWLSKQTAKSLDVPTKLEHSTVLVTITDGEIRVHYKHGEDHPLAVHHFEPVDAGFGYPPVQRLIKDWEPATDACPIRFDPTLLAAYTVSSKKLSAELLDQSMNIELGKSSTSTAVAPVRITIGDRFVGLLQPIRRR